MMPLSRSISTSATTITSLVVICYMVGKKRRQKRTEHVQNETDKLRHEPQAAETLPSIMDQFQDLKLNYNSTIEVANKRRTQNYYQKARDAHAKYDLVPAVRSYPRLRLRRDDEVKRIFRYALSDLPKSHRTIVVMCDTDTAGLLAQARRDILKHLKYSHDISTNGVWIPREAFVPESDLHVTVAIPWWWHTIREGNAELTQQLVARFRQALVHEFHHAFQIELERIILLGGRTLVALWRTVGKRKTASGTTIYDRHGEALDPMVTLRRDIVKCFTTEMFGQQPLTYSFRMNSSGELAKATTPPRPPLKRSNSIEAKTPGLGDHDGFIHTTLARLPLDCLSMKDVELGPIHRLCREATATYCGHRMVVSKYRFLETIGAGGESNPCVAPLFDETIDAPSRVVVSSGRLAEKDIHSSKMVDQSATIGAIPKVNSRVRADSLFQEDSSSQPTF